MITSRAASPSSRCETPNRAVVSALACPPVFINTLESNTNPQFSLRGFAFNWRLFLVTAMSHRVGLTLPSAENQDKSLTRWFEANAFQFHLVIQSFRTWIWEMPFVTKRLFQNAMEYTCKLVYTVHSMHHLVLNLKRRPTEPKNWLKCWDTHASISGYWRAWPLQMTTRPLPHRHLQKTSGDLFQGYKKKLF